MFMEQQNGFSYTYSAPENQEVLNIRKKYLPQEESKLEELKRLDDTVQNSGTTESLCAGIGGALLFGLGLCLAMQVIGTGVFYTVLGMAFGVAGMIGMILAYPICRKNRFRGSKTLGSCLYISLRGSFLRSRRTVTTVFDKYII